jgi:hypothetical protein
LGPRRQHDWTFFIVFGNFNFRLFLQFVGALSLLPALAYDFICALISLQWRIGGAGFTVNSRLLFLPWLFRHLLRLQTLASVGKRLLYVFDARPDPRLGRSRRRLDLLGALGVLCGGLLCDLIVSGLHL